MFDGSIVSFSLVHSDIRSVQADVLALKYAQAFHGADAAVAEALRKTGISIDEMRPPLGKHVLIDAKGGLAAKQVLFVGVPSLEELGYEQIRQFSTRVLEILAVEAPATRDLAMTLHGANIGLDESECANEQLKGYRDALKNGRYPPGLRSITIAEKNDYRMGLLAEFFEQEFASAHAPSGWIGQKNVWPIPAPFHPHDGRHTTSTRMGFPDATNESAEARRKPRVFVAMPFAKEMRDIWEFGIYRTVRNAGLVCERIDEQAFTGDILEQMKKRIETADLMIADLTGANPNVFLEVGYAWGKGQRTLLLSKKVVKKGKEEPLPFDVRGQKYLAYEDAVDLEEKLTIELKGLGINQ